MPRDKRSFLIGQRVELACDNRPNTGATITGEPVTIMGLFDPLWPVTLDEGIYSEDRSLHFTIILTHADSIIDAKIATDTLA